MLCSTTPSRGNPLQLGNSGQRTAREQLIRPWTGDGPSKPSGVADIPRRPATTSVLRPVMKDLLAAAKHIASNPVRSNPSKQAEPEVLVLDSDSNGVAGFSDASLAIQSTDTPSNVGELPVAMGDTASSNAVEDLVP